MDWTKATRYYTNSAAALLAAFATLLFVGNGASVKLSHPREPLLALPADALGWMLGLGAWVVVLVCIFSAQPRLKLALLLWLAVNAVAYRLGLYSMGVRELGGYVGAVAGAFHLPAGVAVGLLHGLFAYLLAGSAGLLVWGALTKAETATRKAICAACGGHIAYAPSHLGQTVPCPHCRAPLALREPGDLKMTCFFCQGHIEFPSHALGTMMPCPHCRKDITLKVAGAGV
jgi:hypothetical protein